MNNINALIVDDSALMRKLLKDILINQGISTIYEANNGDDAIDIYKEKKPNLVTMDNIMPGISGIECLKEILQIDKNANIIMVTSVGQEKIIKNALTIGAKGYLVKPFEANKISDLIKLIFGDVIGR